MSSPSVNPSEANQPSPTRPVDLFLAPQERSFSGILWWMARFYHLDAYGSSLLSRRTVNAMGFGALLLTIIALFDFAAWTLLWNLIFHFGNVGEVTSRTLLAAFFSLLFTGTVFIYEQQFFTADLSMKNGWEKVKIGTAIALRILIIAIAAIITTQPVEIIVFNGPIQRRIHEEAAWAEALKQVPTLVKLNNELKERNDERKKEKLIQAEKEKIEKNNEESIKAAKENKEAARNNLKTFESNYRPRIFSDKGPGGNRTRTIIQVDPEAVAAGREKHNAQLKEAIEQEKRAMATKEEELKKAPQVVDDQTASKKFEHDELVQSLKNIWNAKPGTQVGNYNDPVTDFFQRLRVLRDLRHGTVHRWPATATDADRKLLAEEYKIAPTPATPDEIELYSLNYWITFGLSLIIPLLLIAMKFLLPHELRDYYSSDRQREAGNYDVWNLSRIINAIKQP